MARVLVVDDDVTVREVVVSYLRAAGHEVTEADDGQRCLAAHQQQRADLVVLDVMMPGLDGLEVCRRLRLAGDVPVILLTALGSEQDRVVGLETGADDYVTKPFSPRELVLRVESVLRRSTGADTAASPAVVRDGDLLVDRRSRTVTVGGSPRSLTAREFDLLAFLVSHPGQAFARDELLQHVWGWSFGDSSTVTVHVRRLREKVETDPTVPSRLVTVWGVGYRWDQSTGGGHVNDQLLILLVAAGSGVLVGGLGLVAGWSLRRRSLRWQLALVAVVSVATVLVGVVATAELMLISGHDLEVVLLVSTAAAVISLFVAAALSEALVRWSRELRARVRQLDTDAAGQTAPYGPSEFAGLARDLDEAQRRLREAAAREAQLEGSRRELVSWVSHDLRTPLAGIRAMTEALEDGMAADPARYHRQIRAEVDRMVRMVDDLFELSRIHAGVLRLEPELVLVGDLVSEAIAGADPMARARRVRLDGDVQPGLLASVDPAGLGRVLANLIVNGIRHTPSDGSVHVSARAVGDQVELAVSDGCGGIEPATLPRVFDVAFRGAEARTPDELEGPQVAGRAGLGLAIVKGIVEAHRGAVEVANVETSDAARGCRFVVRLPADTTA